MPLDQVLFRLFNYLATATQRSYMGGSKMMNSSKMMGKYSAAKNAPASKPSHQWGPVGGIQYYWKWWIQDC